MVHGLLFFLPFFLSCSSAAVPSTASTHSGKGLSKSSAVSSQLPWSYFSCSPVLFSRMVGRRRGRWFCCVVRFTFLAACRNCLPIHSLLVIWMFFGISIFLFLWEWRWLPLYFAFFLIEQRQRRNKNRQKNLGGKREKRGSIIRQDWLSFTCCPRSRQTSIPDVSVPAQSRS